MRRMNSEYDASLLPTISGPLDVGERYLVELLTAGTEVGLNEIRHAFLRAVAVERTCRSDRYEIRVRAGVPSLRDPAYGIWRMDDLVVLDVRLDQPVNPVLAVRTRSGSTGEPTSFAVSIDRTDGLLAPWPPSIQVDDWGYLGEGERYSGSLPARRERVVSVPRSAARREVGPVPSWLAVIVGSGDSIVPNAGVARDRIQAFEAEIGSPLPTEIRQFLRWSDGVAIGDMDLFGVDTAFVMDLPGPTRRLVAFATGLSGETYAVDLDEASERTCPVVCFDGSEVPVSPTFSGWLAALIAGIGDR